MSFEKELAGLINKHNMESDSDTPDFILAEYLRRCLEPFNKAVVRREVCLGREKQGPITVEPVVSAKTEIDKLATFIMEKCPDEPGKTGRSESAVDVAIRLLQKKP